MMGSFKDLFWHSNVPSLRLVYSSNITYMSARITYLSSIINRIVPASQYIATAAPRRER